MRMIVEAFKDALELGLAKHKQVVVSISPLYLTHALSALAAYDPDIRIWLANREGGRKLSRRRSGFVQEFPGSIYI